MISTQRIALQTLVCMLAVVSASTLSARADEAAPPRRSIVLVHGAFADGSCWDRVVPLLERTGVKVVSVHAPLTSLSDDVSAVRRAIDQQRGEVVLVGHSYGGAVISEAGVDPKVTRLVYVAAFVPDVGESINDLGKGQPLPPWVPTLQIDSGGFAWLPLSTVLHDFAQDLPVAEGRLLAAKQGPIFAGSFDTRLQAAAWRTKPSWYLRAASDRMIDPAAQAFFAARMGATLTSVESSHVVMLSHPRAVARAILRAAGLDLNADD